jgi:serine/threonine protein kinase
MSVSSPLVESPGSLSLAQKSKVLSVLEEYLVQLEQGVPPAPEELLARHPDLAEELKAYLASLNFLHQAALSFHGPEQAPRSGQVTEGDAGPGQLGDFRIIREVGRGGMGVVYEAEQLSLHRRVALKILPFAATMDRRQLQRFQNEACAAASLEHPHIVPVYAVGCERGVHYYAMKLVDGQSLAAMIDAQRQPSEPRSTSEPRPSGSGGLQPLPDGRGSDSTSPIRAFSTERGPRDAAAFRQIAEWGIQAAEALEHAHSVGVVHRDIKPANLMIDSNGSLWVADFGLARTAADAGLTMTGDVLGTLRYMSPEQALAKHGLVDHRTDVYSLGVTLYELLTGTPAVNGKDREEILNAIMLDEPRLPRALDGAIPRDLETIVLKAMEKNSYERFPSAQEMADDLRRYMEDRPIRSRQPNLLQRLQSWGRRHKPLVRSAVVVLLLAMGGLTVSTLLITAAYHSEIEQRGIAEAKQQEAEDQRATAEREKKRALLFRDKALDALRATTGADVEKLIGAKKELGADERNYLEAIVKRWQAFAAEGETDEHSRALRGAGHFYVGYLWQKLGRLDEARAEYEKARHIQQELAKQFPTTLRHQTDLAETHYNLSILLSGLGRKNEARAESAKALVIRQDLAKRFTAVLEYQQALATSHNSQGAFLLELGNNEAAGVEFAKSRDLVEKLAKRFPDAPGYSQHLAAAHNNLAVALENLGKLTEALREIAKARDVTKELVRRFPDVPDYKKALAEAYFTLGNLLRGVSKPEEARGAYESARDIRKKLAEQFPSVPEHRYKLAYTHNNLGELHRILGRRKEWRIETERAVKIWQKLAEQFPLETKDRVKLGAHYCNLGCFICDDGKPAESLDRFAKAIETLTPVHQSDGMAKLFLRNSYTGRAIAQTCLHKYAQAVKDWDKAIELSPKNDQVRFRIGRANSKLKAGQALEAVAEVAELAKSAGDARQWYSIACFYALASGEVADKRQEFADRAMELLRKAVQSGFRDAALMAKDDDLDPLRKREDFQKLLAELQADKVKIKP